MLLRVLLAISITVTSHLHSFDAKVILGQGGIVDTTFGVAGKTFTSFSPCSYDSAEAITLDSQNNILTAGTSRVGSANPNIALARYLPSGVLDASFGNGGVITTDISNRRDFAKRVIALPNQKILALGYTFISGASGNSDIALARYGGDGTLDSDFGNSGILTTTIERNDYLYASVLQSDGQILAGGYAWSFDPGFNGAFLIRYSANGQIDTSFGVQGIVRTSSGGIEEIHAISEQPDHKILAAGFGWWGDHSSAVVYRYLSTGQLDTNFGSGGFISVSIGMGPNEAYGVFAQPDNKIMVAGTTAITSEARAEIFALRLMPNGAIDTTYGMNGIAKFGISGKDAFAQSAFIQSDGRIVVSGYTRDAFPVEDVLIVRFTSNGDLDATFGTSGVVIDDLHTGTSDNDEGHAVVLQPDGRLLVSGRTFIDCDDFFVSRYVADETSQLLTLPISSASTTITNPINSTAFIFSAASFSTPVTLTTFSISPTYAPPVKDLQAINRFFSVETEDETGHALTPNKPYTISVQYSELDLSGVSESALGLYYWNGNTWVLEPSSGTNATANTVTALPSHFSIWAVLANKSKINLPIVMR